MSSLIVHSVVLQLLILAVLTASVIAVYFYLKCIAQQKNQVYLTEKHHLLLVQKAQLLTNNARLADSTIQLNKANATKDQFFLMIGQDLKSPLLNIISFLQTLNSRAVSFSQEELKNFAGQMNLSVKGLLALLDNLLQWARFQSGKIDYKAETLQLNKLVRYNLNALQAQIENKNIVLTIQMPDILEIKADMNMLQTVIRNLLSHAVTSTANNGSISVAGFRSVESTDLVIEYEYTGNNDGHLEYSIQNKEYVIESGDEQERNLRLNLLICKEFIENNNGKLISGNESGIHSSFRVCLFH